MGSDRAPDRVGTGYASGQLAAAFVAAMSHDDPDVRLRAADRISRWQAVVGGIASGKLRIGSRAPVDDLPVWATPEVVRGGFVTGRAAAEGDLAPHEAAFADRAGLVRDRSAIFGHCLTERGLQELGELLRSGRYRLAKPEDGALLTVAWLVFAGDVPGATALVKTIEPHAGRLCFVPRPGGEPGALSVVCREPVGEVGRAIGRRRPNDQVEAMREALTIWNPFADDLLQLWLDSSVDGRVGAACTDEWRQRATALQQRYEGLAATHQRCKKHLNPKENLAVLVVGLRTFLAQGSVDGRLPHAVSSMVRRRGAPGSDAHRELREDQAANAAIPAHHLLARIVVGRLAGLAQDQGVPSIDELVVPVTAAEAGSAAVPAGTPVPLSIRAALLRAVAGTVEELVSRGLVPSAEVLARLVPQVAAATVAAAYPDETLQRLVAQSYIAFRNRRSLLLLDLEHQVRIDELPWMRSIAPHRSRTGNTAAEAIDALRRLAELTLEGFPATLIPNPLTRELAALAREAGVDAPFVEELAADIFMGTFSSKFLAAAKVAGELLRETAYERYYGIDYAAVSRLAIPVGDDGRPGVAEELAALCRARAGGDQRQGRTVARNGMVIEQAQILTTQNLATLAGPVGLAEPMAAAWPRLAVRCFERAQLLVTKLEANPRPLRTVKDAAYAWRQMIFYLSMADDQARAEFTGRAWAALAPAPDHVKRRITPALQGLAHVLAGGSFDESGEAPRGRRFQGWAVGGHWMLDRGRR